MLCRLLQQSQGRLRRHVHQAVMSVQVMCSKCKRLGGQPAQGAAINGLGCTGACLRWAARLIQNPPTFEDTLGWGAWHGVEPADVASFSADWMEVNNLGCALLVLRHGRSSRKPIRPGVRKCCRVSVQKPEDR